MLQSSRAGRTNTNRCIRTTSLAAIRRVAARARNRNGLRILDAKS
jgi:hypothetical protein